MGEYTVFLDLIILCVLAVTIGFCWKLNNRIIELKSAKSDMASFINSLDNSIITAHKSVMSLNEATEKAMTERQKYVSEGTDLANDLSFMIGSGNRLLQRAKDDITKIESLIEQSKTSIARLEEKTLEFKKMRHYSRQRKNKTNQSIKIQQ